MDDDQTQLADQADEFAPRGRAGFVEGMAVFAIDPVSRISVTHNFFAAADGSDQCHQTLSVNPDRFERRASCALSRSVSI
jgi:hypothetical protein